MARKRSVLVTKSSGEKEHFSESKLIASLQSAGVPKKDAREIIGKIYGQLYPGIPTEELYRIAFKQLKRIQSPLAARYSLKKAIGGLGPSGFPFERVVGAVLSAQGFNTLLDQTVNGVRVTHEIDVIATNKKRKIYVECKYHNRPNSKCDVKVALYVHARALDVRAASDPPLPDFHLFTNTRFTSDAIEYGKGVGLKMVGWDYPAGGGLQTLIEQHRAHPVTCLTTLSLWDKKWLLQNEIVLCKDLRKKVSVLKELGWRDRDLREVRQELAELAGLG